MSYYARQNIVHLDGTAVFQTADDRAAESSVAGRIEAAWKCEIKSFGALSAVDWYAMRYGRVVGVLELKSRTHDTAKHPTVFLNVRKWLALTLASAGLGVPSLFVVRFTDSIRWVPINSINASRFRIAGCNQRVKAGNDIEPVIEVPISDMRGLAPQNPEPE